MTNTGIAHELKDDGSIAMSQAADIQGIQPMSVSNMLGKPADDEVDPSTATEYKSVLGAIAYAMMTQYHLLIYVVAAQRRSHNPQVIHCRRLNALLSHMKRFPRTLVYRSMVCSRSLVCHSDSGFTKEQDKGYGVRAANHLRKGVTATGQTVYHFTQAECRGHRRVTRSTFSSELQAAVDAADELMSLQLCLSEMISGPLSADAIRQQWDVQWTLDDIDYSSLPSSLRLFETELVVDAKSVYSALAAIVCREPAEKTCGVLLFWLRELIDLMLLRKFSWCDTRDLSCDGNTKGSIDRSALLNLMTKGLHSYAHPIETYCNRRVKDSKSTATVSGSATEVHIVSSPNRTTPHQNESLGPTKSPIGW